MTLTRENWPSRAIIQTSLAANFALPPLPPILQDWFAWCQRMGDDSLYLEDPNWRDNWGGLLTGSGAVDVPSLLAGMESYRFILDQKASTPEQLVWHDDVNTGMWQPHWVILQNADGDPLIGDISQPEVPVLWDWHGGGSWSPQPLFPSIRTLMERITVYVPPTPEDLAPAIFYTVRLTDLGSQPLRVLTELKALAQYKKLAGASLLKLKHQLPLLLLDDNSSFTRMKNVVRRFEALGAKIEVAERIYQGNGR